jgi:hypothetical protein
VLDQRAISLLTDESESFLQERKLVLGRSGYHSAGISLARAARKPKESSRGLTAYIMRLFDRRRDDGNLNALLEDLDRAQICIPIEL